MVRHGPPIIPYWHNEDWGHCVWRNWVAFLSLSTSSWVTIHHILVQGKLKAEVDIVSSLDEQARPKPHFRKAILLLKCMILQISKIWRVDNQIKRTELDAADYYINKEECLDWANNGSWSDWQQKTTSTTA